MCGFPCRRFEMFNARFDNHNYSFDLLNYCYDEENSFEQDKITINNVLGYVQRREAYQSQINKYSINELPLIWELII
jgi:hypothetical protein